MDIFGYMNTRNIDIEAIFSREQVTSNQDMHGLLKQLKHTLEKQLRVWWDISTLEMYVTEKITPRRLRWDVNPNDAIDNTDLMKDWYSLFNKCEGELLRNIIKRKQFKMRGIESNITEIKNLLLPFVHLKEYKDKEKELQESITK